MHPLLWPDLIIAVLLAEGIIYSTRMIINSIANRKRNQQIAQRVQDMRPAALDGYRAAVKEGVRAPLG